MSFVDNLDLGPLSEEEQNFTVAIKNNFYRPPREYPCLVVGLTSWESSFKTAVFSQTIWFRRYWWTGVPICGLYLFLIFAGQRFMRDRHPVNIKVPMIIWNLFIAFFSAYGAFRGIVWAIGEFYHGQFVEAVCYVSHADESCAIIGVWPIIFCWSKLLELGDTAFIVLRKRPLIVLHWYHHVTVLLYVWYTFGQGPAIGAFFATMNFFVHSLMYLYYALRAMGYKISRKISIGLTLLQISQMFLGIYLNVVAYQLKKVYPKCKVDFMDFVACTVMYSSYCVLFMWYFYQTYLTPHGRKSYKDVKADPANVATSALIDFVDSYNENMSESAPNLRLRTVANGVKSAVKSNLNGHSSKQTATGHRSKAD
ncbi:unnamed protein product [Cyprideis torosa]|uniref:Elongation of very long chain fatty acids protein n=1 Tax=Cyprideis torosa TaxID=163714 RepID=A0A7R8W818_9CRUS|nr:unnamed protein product [Cyprideis torosa]CAG0888131.1 unnamed protein product [Cyprideis torosa]